MSPMVRRPLGLELALLGFLRQGPQHGYQIHQMMSDQTGLGSIWRLKQSQLYALLVKLEKDGYIWGVLEPQESGRPPRRIFHLTTAGGLAYRNWLRNPVRMPRLIRQEFMAKLYFAKREKKEIAQQLVQKQRAACSNWIDEFNRQQKNSEPGSFRWTMYQYRLGQIEALQSWLDLCEQSLI